MFISNVACVICAWRQRISNVEKQLVEQTII